MYCRNCGTQIDDRAAICVHCGASTAPQPSDKDSNNVGWWWLGFFIPLAGLLVWLLEKDTTPMRAKRAGKGALVSVIISAVLGLVFFVLYIALFAYLIAY